MTGGRDASAVDDDVLRLHAERAVLSRRVVETAIVRVARTTSIYDQAVEENLTDESVVVERTPIGRRIDAVPAIRQEGDTTVFPVIEEVLVVERRLFLKEEVRISRVRSTRQHVETVSLRSQDAVVTRTEIDVPRAGRSKADPGPLTSLPTNFYKRGTDTMDSETIVAVYDTPAHAALAAADLKQAGVPESAISLHASETAATGTVVPPREEGFWASLFGGEPDHDATVYDRSLASGSTVVTVTASASYAEKAIEILESHHPVDIDERVSTYGLAQTTAPRQSLAETAAPLAAAEGGTMQLSEERLSVGKRLVNRGGTRIRRFVVETPVEESVTLHEERVTLERRPVTDGRAVSGADFTDKVIEMTEIAEEVVVAKQAFVTEEIALHKTASDRVETVRDTVRKEDVEIVQIPGETVTTTTTGQPRPVNPAKI